MVLPSDPFMLLSVVNTKLRDFYPSLEAFAAGEDLSAEEIEEKLLKIGYVYDKKLNRFTTK